MEFSNQMDNADIIAALKQFLEEEDLLEDAGEITDDTDLIDSGIIDSLVLVMIVGLCEEEFDCALEPEELVEDNFRTLNTMAAFIGGKIAAA